ncbi:MULTISPECIES: restriction endonuclease subunit S [unclassified Bacteroides]|uniref:restriction endonuclease subunit S n=1 Tax=unclassified Bacteroides TaxID=2646097 RepID=UPI0004E1ADFF|nr:MULTISPECIES: restriction endonuclease subunit S [unclassified Bacteroides]
MTGKQLKNSILQWAIQGKLVPQDPNDEPASVLLEKIRAEKARLVKEGKIKKDKKESIIYRGEDNSHYEKFADGTVVCIDDEIPFDVPKGWELARFGSVMYNRDSERIPLSVSERSKLSKIYDYYGASGVIDKVDKYLFDKDLLLIGEDGANLINRSTPIAYIATGKYWVNNHAHVLDCIDFVFMQYVCLYINSISLVDYVTGTAQPKMNQEKMNSILIFVPPYNEQKRILEKVDEIQPLVVRYGKNQLRLEALIKTLYTNMRKSILQEAIQGKLISQDPNDEPASVLLQRIKEEKLRLVKEGKLKKKDVVDSVIFKGDDNRYYEKVNGDTKCIDDEIPFDIPESWRWIRLSNISIVARGGSPRPIKEYITESSNGVNWIKIGDSEKGGKYINKCAEKIKPEGVSKSRLVKPGDFLLTNSMSFGRPYITNVEGCIHDGWLVISQFIPVYNTDFLFFLLSSPFAYGQFSGKTAGAVVQNLNKDKVADSFFPLPPIQEQKRIVAIMERLIKEL